MAIGWRFCEKHKKKYKSGTGCPYCDLKIVELKVFNPTTGKKEKIDFKAKEIDIFNFNKDIKNKTFRIEIKGKLR